MDQLFDNLSRILASPMPRRQALRLAGGAFAAALFAGFSVRPVMAADCTPAEKKVGHTSCGSGKSATCCPPGTCCASKGNMTNCCAKGQCVCDNGTCGASKSNVCPKGCKAC